MTKTKRTKLTYGDCQLFVLLSCDPGGARTLDPLIKSQLLYQLSYGVIMCAIVQLRMQRYKHFFNYQQYFKKNRPQYLLFYPKTHQIAPTSNHFHPKNAYLNHHFLGTRLGLGLFVAGELGTLSSYPLHMIASKLARA